jgi:hypothetical protein
MSSSEAVRETERERGKHRVRVTNVSAKSCALALFPALLFDSLQYE